MTALHDERGEHERQAAVLRADAYHEHSHRSLMTLLATQGHGAEALVLYQHLEALLRAELSATPAADPQALTN
jgi:DNA-binding SARP family transcriptional activator